MRFWLRVGLAGLVVGLLLLGVGWYLWTTPVPGTLNSAADLRVRIPTGATWSAASDSLVRHRLLRFPRILNLGVRLFGRESQLKAGLYALPAKASPRTLMTILTSGAAVPIRVTLPEGWNAVEVAREVSRQLGFSPESFLVAADSLVRHLVLMPDSAGNASSLVLCDSLLTTEKAQAGNSLHLCEGYLAPDTYLFAEGSGPAQVARHLVSTQLARLAEVAALPRAALSSTLDSHQLLTLASIVEAEARLAAEQPLIAAVYLNRLQKGWKLEADPTVAFVLGRKGQRLFHRDLAVESAYNTYRHAGLPPGPIGNPGLGALRAVVQPDTTCQAMFFVSDGRRGHVFSRTADEHARAVRRFRKIRSQARRQQGQR